MFCAGANIRMLGKASHGAQGEFLQVHQRDPPGDRGCQREFRPDYLAAISGTAAGGGYELAVTAEHIMLIDDRRSTVSLPESPLLAVLPGTGGLTRLTDKRRVRRDLADVFCTTEEGVRGKRAVEWRLVDEVVPPSAWEATVAERAPELAARSDRPADAGHCADRRCSGRSRDDACRLSHVQVDLDRAARRADDHRARPGGSAGRPGVASTPPARHSGRWRWRANSTTRCCICG